MFLLEPIKLIKNYWSNRQLIKQFSEREILSRYKGSFLGIFWSFITPLIMITVYTFVFSVVFKGRWGIDASDNKFEFAVIMFCGLTVYNIFNEVINRSPMLIVSNVNYVKKVIFPLEILPATALISTLVHALINMVILIIATNIFVKTSSWTIILAFLVLVPLLMFVLGLSLLVSSLGVYIRDLSNTVGLITTVLFYITPIFYPISAVPEFLRPYMYINPLTSVVENFRSVVIWGNAPDWNGLLINFVVSYVILSIGYNVFKKVQRGFSDVL